jgi:protein-S-isoprenylcysteine O-methyltransferase Ste14
MKYASVAAFILMIAGIVPMAMRGELFARSSLLIAWQVVAILLMLWARVTFGRRSFHAAANPTAGGLVTTGPYRYLRHPIYAAVLYFVWGGALDHRTLTAVACAAAVSVGAGIRMVAEEHLLAGSYPAYRE